MLAAAALAALAVGGSASASVKPAASPGWRQVWSAHYGAAANDSVYGHVVATSENNAWVLGGSNQGFGYAPSGTPVAVHWNGKRWSGYAMPKGVTGVVAAASGTSADDIWAVTQYSGYVLHWNGTRWSVAKRLPDNLAEVTGITAISATDVWVFGGGGVIGGIGTWHYNGKTWQQQKGNAAGLERASALSATSIWAVGGPDTPDSALEHFNGKNWQFVTAKALAGLSFFGISAFSSTNIWVATAGSANNLRRYNGKSWTSVTLPWQVSASAPVSDGHGGLWFVGSSTTGQYLIHRSVTGRWTRSVLRAPGIIAAVPGTMSLWAVGAKAAGAGTNAVIWADGAV